MQLNTCFFVFFSLNSRLWSSCKSLFGFSPSFHQWIWNLMLAWERPWTYSLSAFFVPLRCFRLRSQTCRWPTAWLILTHGGCLRISMSFAWWEMMQIICMRSLCKSFLTTVAFISLKQHGLVSHQHKVTMKGLMMSCYSCIILKC